MNTKISYDEDVKESMDALHVGVTWQDLEEVDHSKDTIKVQLYEGGVPYGEVIELGNGKWNYTWDFQNQVGWYNHDWEVRVVENKEGYQAKIQYHGDTNTFQIMNQQQELMKNKVISVQLQWDDAHKVEHSDDRIKVQLYRDGQPYGSETILGYWIHDWELSEKEFLDHTWEVKVIENKQGYISQVQYDKETSTFKILNTKITGTVHVRALDSSNDRIGLKGAIFIVKDTDGNKVSEIVTDAYGNASVMLPEGEYTLHQIQAPQGYQVVKNVYQANVKHQGEDIILHIEHFKAQDQDIINEDLIINEDDEMIGNDEDNLYYEEIMDIENGKNEQENKQNLTFKNPMLSEKKEVSQQKKDVVKSNDKNELKRKETVQTSDYTRRSVWWISIISSILGMGFVWNYQRIKSRK